MNANPALLSPGQAAKTVDGVVMPATPVASLDRRSPSRQGSRGNKVRLSQPIIARLVQAFDLLLLLLSGLVAKSMLAPLPWTRTDGSLILATFVGTLVTLISLRRSQAYLVRSLLSLGNALKVMFLSLSVGLGCMIVGLFMGNDAGPGFREWSLCWLTVSAFLLTASRVYLSRLLHAWTYSGRLARRVAVLAPGNSAASSLPVCARSRMLIPSSASTMIAFRAFPECRKASACVERCATFWRGAGKSRLT